MTAIQKAREALAKSIMDLICDDVLPAYGISSEVGRSDVELPEAICSALAALDAETEVKATPTEFNQIGMTLAFFACAIKSGDNWTATCQREYDAAQACLTQLRSALVPPESRS